MKTILALSATLALASSADAQMANIPQRLRADRGPSEFGRRPRQSPLRAHPLQKAVNPNRELEEMSMSMPAIAETQQDPCTEEYPGYENKKKCKKDPLCQYNSKERTCSQMDIRESDVEIEFLPAGSEKLERGINSAPSLAAPATALALACAVMSYMM